MCILVAAESYVEGVWNHCDVRSNMFGLVHEFRTACRSPKHCPGSRTVRIRASHQVQDRLRLVEEKWKGMRHAACCCQNNEDHKPIQKKNMVGYLCFSMPMQRQTPRISEVHKQILLWCSPLASHQAVGNNKHARYQIMPDAKPAIATIRSHCA